MKQKRMTDRQLLEAIEERLRLLVKRTAREQVRPADRFRRRATDRELMEAILEAVDTLVAHTAGAVGKMPQVKSTR
jgi:hypothetical protein